MLHDSKTLRSEHDMNRSPSRGTSFRRTLTEYTKKNQDSIGFHIDTHSFPTRSNERGDIYLIDDKPGKTWYSKELVKFIGNGMGKTYNLYQGPPPDGWSIEPYYNHNDIQDELRENGILSVLIEFNEYFRFDEPDTNSRLRKITSLIADWVTAKTIRSIGIGTELISNPILHALHNSNLYGGANWSWETSLKTSSTLSCFYVSRLMHTHVTMLFANNFYTMMGSHNDYDEELFQSLTLPLNGARALFLIPDRTMNKNILEFAKHPIEIQSILDEQDARKCDEVAIPKFAELFVSTSGLPYVFYFGNNGITSSEQKERKGGKERRGGGGGKGCVVNQPFMCFIIGKETSQILFVSIVITPENPFKSAAHRRAMYANAPKVARRWARKYGSKIRRRKRRRRGKRRK